MIGGVTKHNSNATKGLVDTLSSQNKTEKKVESDMNSAINKILDNRQKDIKSEEIGSASQPNKAVNMSI